MGQEDREKMAHMAQQDAQQVKDKERTIMGKREREEEKEVGRKERKMAHMAQEDAQQCQGACQGDDGGMGGPVRFNATSQPLPATSQPFEQPLSERDRAQMETEHMELEKIKKRKMETKQMEQEKRKKRKMEAEHMQQEMGQEGKQQQQCD